MKNWQFLMLAGLLMSITSNVEDNHAMKVWWGVCSPFFFVWGLAGMIKEFGKWWKEI